MLPPYLWPPTWVKAMIRPQVSVDASPRLPTPHLLLGPFYPLEPARAPAATLWHGEETPSVHRMRLSGVVRRLDGRPVPDALVEIWHADWLGRYRHPSAPDHHLVHSGFDGYGRMATDSEGTYLFSTVVPGSYHQGGVLRAPHVHFQVTTRYDRLVTQAFIRLEGAPPRDPWLDAVRRPDALIANVIRETHDVMELQWNITLAIS
jgi:protocatechuate 3,4-dioxygenase beta subunit